MLELLNHLLNLGSRFRVCITDSGESDSEGGLVGHFSVSHSNNSISLFGGFISSL